MVAPPYDNDLEHDRNRDMIWELVTKLSAPRQAFGQQPNPWGRSPPGLAWLHSGFHLGKKLLYLPQNGY